MCYWSVDQLQVGEQNYMFSDLRSASSIWFNSVNMEEVWMCEQVCAGVSRCKLGSLFWSQVRCDLFVPSLILIPLWRDFSTKILWNVIDCVATSRLLWLTKETTTNKLLRSAPEREHLSTPAGGVRLYSW